MSVEENKIIARRFNDEIWSQGDVSVVDEIVASAIVFHDPAYPVGVRSIKDFRQYHGQFRKSFPDLHFTIKDLVAEGSKVAYRWACTGTHQGELMGIPPTGVKAIETGIISCRIANGKITEAWSFWDALGLMQQLGVVTPGRESYAWGIPSQVTGAPGTPEANKAIIHRLREEFWNQKNPDVLNETHSPDAVAHNPLMPGNPLSFDAAKQASLMHIAAFPDLKVANEETIAEGDKIVDRWTVSGTHQGELMGIPASGRKVTWTGTTIYRFADDKIVENWWCYDALGLMQQIGVVPTPG